MQKNYKISILGGYGLRNFGDDALMYILHKVFSSQYKEKDIAYICTPSQYLKRLVNSTDIIDIKNHSKVNTSMLIYGGGTQFYSFKPKKSLLYKIFLSLKEPKIFIAKIRNKLIKKHMKSIRINSKSAIGIGVGPFLSNANKNIEFNTKQLFLGMDFVGVRDIYSLKKCKEWGLTNVRQYADLCYLMEEEVKFKNKKISNKIKKIGIIVRDWTQTEEGSRYYSKIFPLVDDLKSSGYEVNILLFSQKRDIFWLKELKNIDNIVTWDPDKDTILEFLQILDTFDLFITARYHGAVFSTLLDKPFISICVEQKLEMISDLYKNGSKKWIYPFDEKECSKYVKEIDINYNEYKNNISTITKKQNFLANEMMKDFMIGHIGEEV